MKNQARTATVWICLIASMTVGALILMALDRQSPSAGAFSLASYRHLNPVEEVALKSPVVKFHKWDNIEVQYGELGSRTLSLISNPASNADINTHFVICNSSGQLDGQIMHTIRWQKQRPCLPDKNFYGSGSTIRISIVTDGSSLKPTDSQLKRTAALVDLCSRKFNISSRNIIFPADWKL